MIIEQVPWKQVCLHLVDIDDDSLRHNLIKFIITLKPVRQSLIDFNIGIHAKRVYEYELGEVDINWCIGNFAFMSDIDHPIDIASIKPITDSCRCKQGCVTTWSVQPEFKLRYTTTRGWFSINNKYLSYNYEQLPEPHRSYVEACLMMDTSIIIDENKPIYKIMSKPPQDFVDGTKSSSTGAYQLFVDMLYTALRVREKIMPCESINHSKELTTYFDRKIFAEKKNKTRRSMLKHIMEKQQHRKNIYTSRKTHKTSRVSQKLKYDNMTII